MTIEEFLATQEEEIDIDLSSLEDDFIQVVHNGDMAFVESLANFIINW